MLRMGRGPKRNLVERIEKVHGGDQTLLGCQPDSAVVQSLVQSRSRFGRQSIRLGAAMARSNVAQRTIFARDVPLLVSCFAPQVDS